MDAGGAADESATLRTAKSCGPDASMVGFKSLKEISAATVTTKPDHRGARSKPLKPSRPGVPVRLTRVLTTLHARLRAQRAPGIPRSPLGVANALFLGRKESGNNSGATRGEKANVYLSVIASAAKQSTLASLLPNGLLRFARNDD
jgi:hypothetical protein